MKLLAITILLLAAYVLCFVRMIRLRIPRPPIIPFFLLFLVAALWAASLLLPPTRFLGFISLGLVFVAPALLFLCSSLLFRRAERSIFHITAMWLGWLYLAVPVFFMIIV